MTPPAPARTIFTTLLGVLTILIGGLASVFSAFALLLAIGKPYANSSSDPLGIFLIFILPPVTLLAGICLLLRHRWARWWMVLLTACIIVFGIKGLGVPDPAYAPMPGHAADAARRFGMIQSVASISAGSLALLGLFSRKVRSEFAVAGKSNSPALPQDQSGGWRVGHTGRDMMYYEENYGGKWQRIALDGEMLTGRAHHVIYFAAAETWQRYPEWARHRREEIIARIKSRFCEPDYEYAGGGTASVAAPAIPAAKPNLPSNDGTILPMLAFLALIAAASFWFAARGVERGETRLPAKHSHVISRAEKPALFWTSIALLSTTGGGCAVLGAWLVIGRIRGR